MLDALQKGWAILETLVELLERGHVFERRRKKELTKALAVYSYHFGLSLRRTSQMVSFLEPASHEAIRKWYRRLGRRIPPVQRKHRSIVAIDETVVKISGKRFYIWAAIDVHSREVISVGLSSGRTDLEAMAFFRKVLPLCAGNPVFLVDRGPWYDQALKALGVRFQHMIHGLRNSIERWFGLLKSRTKRFHNSFPHRSSIDSVRSRTSAFTGLYSLDQRIARFEEVLS